MCSGRGLLSVETGKVSDVNVRVAHRHVVPFQRVGEERDVASRIARSVRTTTLTHADGKMP